MLKGKNRPPILCQIECALYLPIGLEVGECLLFVFISPYYFPFLDRMHILYSANTIPVFWAGLFLVFYYRSIHTKLVTVRSCIRSRILMLLIRLELYVVRTITAVVIWLLFVSINFALFYAVNILSAYLFNIDLLRLKYPYLLINAIECIIITYIYHYKTIWLRRLANEYTDWLLKIFAKKYFEA